VTQFLEIAAILMGPCKSDDESFMLVSLRCVIYLALSWQTQGRESIAAKLAANLITEAGANRVLTCDLHSGQSMGYFDIPVDHVYGQPVILDYLASKMLSSDDLVVVSPDVGGVARARAFAKKLSDAPLAIVDKRRQGHNISEVCLCVFPTNDFGVLICALLFIVWALSSIIPL
jgi:ribose-phosphate pyrophosphokinase